MKEIERLVTRTTVANPLRRNGIDPAPERGSRMSWRTFPAAHWSTIAAIELRGRRVHFAGMTPRPDEAWIRQVGLSLTDPLDGFVREKRFCLMDRDAEFTTAFRALLAGTGIERFMRSMKSECLDRMIFFGEDSLRRAVRKYVAHDHTERNHQGLGGMLRHCHRDAA